MLAGIAVALGLYAAVVGIIDLRRSRLAGLVFIALFGIVGSLAAVAGRTETSSVVVLPSLIGAGGAALALHAFAWPNRRRPGNGQPSMKKPPSRRRFLATAGVVAAGAVAAAAAGRAGARQSLQRRGLPPGAYLAPALADLCLPSPPGCRPVGRRRSSRRTRTSIESTPR